MKTDHDRIYLEPLSNVDPHGGERQWCQDNVWPDSPECQGEGVEYIRADLIAKRVRWELIILAVVLTLFWIMAYKLFFSWNNFSANFV